MTCTNCKETVGQRLRSRAVDKMYAERENWFGELFGNVAQRIGYQFDPSRIKINMSLKPVPVYGKETPLII